MLPVVCTPTVGQAIEEDFGAGNARRILERYASQCSWPKWSERSRPRS